MTTLEEFLKEPEKYVEKTYKLQVKGVTRKGKKVEGWLDVEEYAKTNGWYNRELGGPFSGLTAEEADKILALFVKKRTSSSTFIRRVVEDLG